MKFEINEAERFIKIKDLLKFHYFMLVIVLGLIIFNAILHIEKIPETNNYLFSVIYIIFGIAGVILLLYKTFKKSASRKIFFDEIESLNEKTVFGQKRFSLKLKNGKLRDLHDLKTQSEITELKNTFEKIGIKTT